MAAEVARGLYARLLGPDWLLLAEPVRCAHASSSTRARGSVRIAHGRGPVVRLLAALLCLPRPNAAAETRLVITAEDGAQRWDRTFDGRHIDTRQYETDEGELAERFGMLELRFRLAPSGGGLIFRQVKAAVMVGSLRLPLPGSWLPIVEAREDPAGARRISVHVRVMVPAIGPLMSYEGMFDIEDGCE